MSKFKVGDRVRAIDSTSILKIGSEHVVESINGRGWVEIKVPGFGRLDYGGEYFELVEPEPTAPLTIQAGKFYKTRDGRKVGPMRSSGRGYLITDFWHYAKDGECCYLGVSGSDTHPEHDLIAEWVDEPAAEPQPAIPTIGDWVRDEEGRIGIVFYDDGDDYDNLYVGYTDDGDWETVDGKYLTIVPPGTKRSEPEPANDNYAVGDIVEIVDDEYFIGEISVGDLAAVIKPKDEDGDYYIRVLSSHGAKEQFARATSIRPYRRTA